MQACKLLILGKNIENAVIQRKGANNAENRKENSKGIFNVFFA